NHRSSGCGASAYPERKRPVFGESSTLLVASCEETA
ncbi:MAG: hypothetical protein ACI9BH_001126, partial [Paracoccaceae bacterium]